MKEKFDFKNDRRDFFIARIDDNMNSLKAKYHAKPPKQKPVPGLAAGGSGCLQLLMKIYITFFATLSAQKVRK